MKRRSILVLIVCLLLLVCVLFCIFRIAKSFGSARIPDESSVSAATDLVVIVQNTPEIEPPVAPLEDEGHDSGSAGSSTAAAPSNTPVPTNTPSAPSNTPVPANTPSVPSYTPVAPSYTPVAPSNTPAVPSPTPAVSSPVDEPEPEPAPSTDQPAQEQSTAGGENETSMMTDF